MTAPGKNVRPYLKKKKPEKRTGGMAQVVEGLGPEFTPHYHQEKFLCATM
jgi:hypothetical protein